MSQYYTIDDLDITISDVKSESYDCSLEKDISEHECVDTSADVFCESVKG